jgi:ribonucleoside-triphosphate reductase (formate)
LRVIKRDGRIEEFNRMKVFDAVQQAASRVYIDELPKVTLASSVVNELEDYLGKHQFKQISVDEIHNEVENILTDKDFAVGKEYILYRNNRTRIREMKSELMDTIEELSKEMSKENANTDPSAATKMYQIASAANKKYVLTRILKPEHAKAHIEGDIHIHDMDYYQHTINCMTHDLGRMLREGFDNGVGFIRPPKRIGSACALTAIILQSMQNNMFGGQAIDFLDRALAPYVEVEYDRWSSYAWKYVDQREFNLADWAWEQTEKATYQAMEALVYNLNTMKARSGNQVPFTSFNFGTDTSENGRMVIRSLLEAFKAGLGNGESPLFPNLCFRLKKGVNMYPGDPNYDMFKLALECAAVRMHPTFAFMDSTFNAPFGDEAGYMGCRTRVLSNINGKSGLAGKGNLFFTTINLPRLALRAKSLNQLSDIFTPKIWFQDYLDKTIDLVINQLLERYEVVKKLKVKDLPFAMAGYYMGSEELLPDDFIEPAIKNGTLTIGFIGLAECLKVLIGKHHGECEFSQKLGIEIIKHIRQRLESATMQFSLNFSLIATPAEGLSGRFTKLDQQQFGIIEGVTDKEFYTNSFHVPVDFECTMSHKIDIEAPYHELTNAGHISYIELPYPPKDNIEGLEKIVLYMAEKNMGYAGINFPIDHCSDCYYLGVIDSECPKCGGTRIKRVRRITGYMSEESKFNDAKLAELKNRVSHGGRLKLG